MAISVTNGNRGTATEKTSDQNLTLTPSGTLAAGNYALLAVVIDNTSSSAGQTTAISVADNGPGATWTRLREQTQATSAALDGVSCALFLAYLGTSLTTSHTVTISLTASATAKGAGLAELSCAAGKYIALSASGTNGSNAAASTSYSVALSGLTSVAGLYVGMSSAEDELDSAVTLDTAYTEIGFGSIGSGTSGLNATNVRARVGYLSNTSTGDTFDASSLTSDDRATILVRLEELGNVNTKAGAGVGEGVGIAADAIVYGESGSAIGAYVGSGVSEKQSVTGATYEDAGSGVLVGVGTGERIRELIRTGSGRAGI